MKITTNEVVYPNDLPNKIANWAIASFFVATAPLAGIYCSMKLWTWIVEIYPKMHF